MSAALDTEPKAPSDPDPDHDVIVIGAGICGLYAIHLLNQRGFDAICLEAADGIGGVWYANHYPGCRFDSESYSYGYSFSPDVLAEWSWKELFAPQEETLRYIDFVADRHDLRRHVRLNSRVDRAGFDERKSLWKVHVEDGSTFTARFLLTAIGLLSVPAIPRLDGLADFRGTAVHTHDWPREGIDLAGKRVGIIGTGSSGVQVITSIADEVAELTVFQRTPHWCVPLNNQPIDDAEMERIRASYDEIFDRCRETPGGFIHGPLREKTVEKSPQERRAVWEDLYDSHGFALLYANYVDTGIDPEANALLSEFVAEKIRERVDDPRTAEMLIPDDHGFGSKRVVLESGYYEVYNRPNVSLVSLRETPIQRVTETGIETSEASYDLDVIVFATGYDAVTGPFERIDFRGVDGMTLKQKWADGPITYLGVQVAGFPNLFMLTGPQSGSGSSNFPRGIEEICDWVADFLDFARAHRHVRIEPRPGADEEWFTHVEERAETLLMSKTRSWYTGYSADKKPPKPRRLFYLGGAPRYRRFLEQQKAEGYPGFVFDADRSGGSSADRRSGEAAAEVQGAERH